MEEAKQELKDVVEFLRDPERFKRLGGKMPTGEFSRVLGATAAVLCMAPQNRVGEQRTFRSRSRPIRDMK